jgi:hypothetical protein
MRIDGFSCVQTSGVYVEEYSGQRVPCMYSEDATQIPLPAPVHRMAANLDLRPVGLC